MAVAEHERRRAELKAHLKALNEQFAAWIRGASTTKPDELWSAGCRDYLKHAEDLEREYRDAIEAASPAQQGNGSAAFPTFGATGFGAGSAPAFGGFGGLANGTPSSSSLFAPMPSPIVTASAAGGDDDEPPRPSSPSLKANAENADAVDSLFESKSKVFKLGSDQNTPAWSSLGVGVVSLDRPNKGDGSPFLVFRNEAGKVLLRAGLYKNMKVMRKGKTASMALFPAKELGESEAEGSPKAITFSFKFGKEDKVAKLESAIATHAPK